MGSSDKKTESKSIDIQVYTWRDLKGYILPSAISFLIGVVFFYFQSYFFGIIFLLAGPCMFYSTLIQIRKAIKADEDRGHYCPACNSLLRLRYLNGVDEDGTIWDGQDFYCFNCQNSVDIEINQPSNSEDSNDSAVEASEVKPILSPSSSIVQMFLFVAWIAVVFVGLPFSCLNAFFELQKRSADKDAPVMSGIVINREKIIYKGFVPGVDFSIKAEGEDTIIHAKTQRYLLDQVAKGNGVRFHYTGNTDREVYLLDYEEDPFLEFILTLFAVPLLTIPSIIALKKIGLAKIRNKIFNVK